MTNLQEAYRAAAAAFVNVVVGGEPADIIRKLQQCPIITMVDVSDDGRSVFYKSCGHDPDMLSNVNLPSGIVITKSVTFMVRK